MNVEVRRCTEEYVWSTNVRVIVLRVLASNCMTDEVMLLICGLNNYTTCIASVVGLEYSYAIFFPCCN